MNSDELNEKNISKNITSFSSFVKITKQTISNFEMYSALKLPFSYSYFIVFYYEFFNSKKSFRFIIRKLLRLNYLISYSIVLLPVNKKVELLTMLTRWWPCRMCTSYLNLTWLWKTDTYHSIKMTQWTLNTYLQRVRIVEILKD